MTRKLFYKDGTEVKVGDVVTSFRGEPATVRGWEQNGRNRVYVTWGDAPDDPFGRAEYFVSVFNLEWFPDQSGRLI